MWVKKAVQNIKILGKFRIEVTHLEPIKGKIPLMQQRETRSSRHSIYLRTVRSKLLDVQFGPYERNHMYPNDNRAKIWIGNPSVMTNDSLLKSL